MTTYTYSQLEGLWEQAGGSTALAPVMAAIAMAESGGNSDAYNASGATGLWQILGAVNASDQGSLTNPQTNAKEAVLKYKTQGLGAWTTYTSGAYEQFLQSGTAATNTSGTQQQQSNATSGSSPGGVVGFAESIPLMGGLFTAMEPFIHAIATVIDYSFGVFEPGQGLRIAFGAGALVMLYLSYKVLASSGAMPQGLVPGMV